MKILGNLIWLLFGGLIIAIEYFLAGLVLCITIIGIPFGIQAFKLGLTAIWPFHAKLVPNARSGGCLGVILNLIWIVFFGIWIALTHIFWGLILFITIIGIPFANQHFKLATVALTPFNYKIQ
ncbi:YccF domain-containing protein [Natronoflexus pectinivorans]|uniref:Uncharacterized membrane protein YccF (DUF307 family) n=1 Tax=Natronoflexus pectinivorans TaxID=682526 RepID=A0A4V2RX12_9BACT|nr:YccF domain-containing protein [Natronoflexus pectinivorans]TCO11041.1 uncharacterized membrane protein YccF (DUF307 family) [Natronoflexus pectinivorans]